MCLQLAGVPVLVVDDNATNRRILEESVVRWKMMPTAVEDAAAALQALQQRRVGTQLPLVLTDAHMPESMDSVLSKEFARTRRFPTLRL